MAERCWACGGALCFKCKEDVGHCSLCEGTPRVINKVYGSGGRQR